MKKQSPREPRKQPRVLEPKQLEPVSGGYGVGNTGGVHPNPPIGPGG